MSRTASIGFSVALSLLARVGEAQVSSAAGVGALVQRQNGGLWESLTRIEPAARFDSPYARLGGEATFRAGNGTTLERGNIVLVAETPAWHGLRLSNHATTEQLDVQGRFPRRRGDFESALTFAVRSSGAWLGLGSERSFAASGYHGDALLRAGIWHQVANMTLVLSNEAHGLRALEPRLRIDTLAGDTSSHRDYVARIRRWSDVEARVLWSIGRLSLDGRLGIQGDTGVGPSSLWGRATATVALAQRLSLVSSFGTQASRGWTGTPSARFASVGVRIAPAILARPATPVHVQPTASRFAVRPAEAGMYVVTIQAPLARTVELSGDFNGWHSVSMSETRPDVWEATIALAPGTYHVNMRVNGAAWIAPPGLSQSADEFNGTVGLLIVP